jgi:hypothetical protein
MPHVPEGPEEKRRTREGIDAFLRGEPSGPTDGCEIIARLQRGDPVDPED